MKLHILALPAMLAACAMPDAYDPPQRVPPVGDAVAICQSLKPVLPRGALARYIAMHRTVVVRVHMNSNGEIGPVQIVKSSTDELLDAAALTSIKGMKCESLTNHPSIVFDMAYVFDVG